MGWRALRQNGLPWKPLRLAHLLAWLLLAAVASEAAAAAKQDGRRVRGRPAALAERRCRLHPADRHPWQRALGAGRPTGAQAVFAPLLRAAKRSGAPAPRLALIFRVLRLLEN